MFGAQSHFFTRSSFAALTGVQAELGRMSDQAELGRMSDGSRRHSSSDESPPWVCEKCAKKHDPEMGCGEVIQPSDIEVAYVESTKDIDDVLGYSHTHRSYEDAMGCDKCKEGQRRKRRKAAEAAAGLQGPWNQSFRVANLGHTHTNRLGQQEQALTCPIGPGPSSYDPSLNCMRDARGNAVCSDGLFYPPGCPKTPPDQYFSPGVTPDEVIGGIIQGKIPAPRSGGGSPAGPGSTGGTSTGTLIAAGAGALGLGALLFVLFK